MATPRKRILEDGLSKFGRGARRQKGHSSTLSTFRAFAEGILETAKTCRATPEVRERLTKAAAAIVAATPPPTFLEKHGGKMAVAAGVLVAGAFLA